MLFDQSTYLSIHFFFVAWNGFVSVQIDYDCSRLSIYLNIVPGMNTRRFESYHINFFKQCKISAS
jgi:hypothetical protein